MQLYVLKTGGGCREILKYHHNYPIAGHIRTKCILELVSRKYYYPAMVCKVKAYTWAGNTCQRIHSMLRRMHRNIEPLLQLRDPWMYILLDFIVRLSESYWKCHAKLYNANLVVIDRYTKQACYFLYHDLLDAIGLAEIYASELLLQGIGIL
jgi:hypothetical protein